MIFIADQTLSWSDLVTHKPLCLWLIFSHVTPKLQYKQIRDEKRAQKLFKQDLLDDAFKPKNDMLSVPTKNIPSVADVIGKTLPMIGKYGDLGETEKWIPKC